MTQTTRCFIAIVIPPEIQNTLVQIMHKAQISRENGFRPVRAGMIHLTLNFLGDLTVQQIQEIQKGLIQIVQNIEPFDIYVKDLGVFPSWDHPQTIWAGLVFPPELSDLHHQIDLLSGKAGIPVEGKRFAPHLTLARVSDQAEPARIKTGVQKLRLEPAVQYGAVGVDRIILFKSTLQPGGSVYEPLSEHPFLGKKV